MRFRNFLAALVLFGVTASAAHAALDRYYVRVFTIADFGLATPKTLIFASEPGDGSTLRDVVVMDRTGPTLRKLLIQSNDTQTTIVSGFNGFLWFSVNWRDGPVGTFSSTNHSLSTVSNSGSVAWPVLTGWAITGKTFCNSTVQFICSLAVGANLATIDPVLRSSFYDVGPWEFHGTGFTSSPFVFFTATVQGNSQVILKGAADPNATVPALPLLGAGALGASLLAMGVAALRRRRL